MMRPLMAVGVALAVTGCATPAAGLPNPEDPVALMAYAWAQPYRDLGDGRGPWLASAEGLCRNKVLWAMAQCRCGEPIIGWREVVRDDGSTGREFHMALQLPEDGVVVDFDGVWPEYAYPMERDTMDWSPRYGGD
jgi:hypothetical protein